MAKKSILSNLEFIDPPTVPQGGDPNLRSRNTFIRAINEQIEFAKLPEGAPPAKVWWRNAQKGGQTYLRVRYGQLPLFGGKVIQITSQRQLIPTLEKLKEAAEAGELDDQFAEARLRQQGKSKGGKRARA